MKSKWIDKKINKLLVLFFIFLFFCGFAVWSYFEMPIAFGPCPVLEYLNIKCPGCGGTRACRAISRLDFVSAFKLNMLLIIVGLYLGIVAINCVYKVVIHNKFVSIKTSHAIVIIISMVVFAVIRNMPFYPWY
jgi:hypothetical protein